MGKLIGCFKLLCWCKYNNGFCIVEIYLRLEYIFSKQRYVLYSFIVYFYFMFLLMIYYFVFILYCGRDIR